MSGTPPLPDEIEARLLGPGGPFETRAEEVLGERMSVFRQRPRSLREVLERSRAHGELDYVVYEGERWSYERHYRAVASVALALSDRYGVARGERVAILAANRPEWVITFWAAVALGAVPVGLNGWWAGHEILYGLDDSQPRVLVGDRRRLARLADTDPGVPVVEMEADFAGLLAHAPDAALPEARIAEDDPACILYTSGTTGRPKGAVNSHRGIVALLQLTMFNGIRNAMRAGARPAAPAGRPCALVTTPFFHVSGLYAGAVMMLFTGSRMVLRAGRFDPLATLALIERERVTGWGPMGTMAYRVVHHPDVAAFDLSSVVNIGSGGAPMAPELQERIRAAFPNASRSLGLGYGLTECTALATVCSGDDLVAHPDSVGRPLPTVELEVRDGAGRALPEGAEGEIHVRSPLVMLGYWRNPEATAETLLPGRWLRTGDVGRIVDGRLYVNARARDLILRGGENVYPVEIEQRLEAHPGVREAAVVGVDHPELGQEVKAFVVPEEGASPDEATLAAWVADALAAFKVPARWEVRREPLPRNATGKVLKTVLLGETGNAFVDES